MTAKVITDVKQLTDDQLREVLWRQGTLRWKLKPCQRDVYNAIRATQARGGRRFVGRMPRRFGKSFIAGVLLIEDALRVQNGVFHYAAETGKQVKNIVLPNFRQILKDCPKDITPTYRRADGVYWFPSTGSEIHLAGCEDEAKADRLLGTASNMFVIDEAGHIGDGAGPDESGLLDYVIDSVAMPQTLTTNGFILELSTTPLSPAHPFRAHCLSAESGGYGMCRTIHDSTRFSADKIAEYCREAGGEESIVWKREYLSEFVVNEMRAVLPDFARFKHANTEHPGIVREMVRPEHYRTWLSIDLGFAPDLTAVGVGYYDFVRAVLVQEDELIMQRMLTSELAEGLVALETRTFGKPVDQRYGDITPLVQADIARNHDLYIAPIQKHDKESAINETAMWLRSGRVAIHPRCVHTIASCEAAIWNKQRTQFERMSGLGHFDACDMLIYAVRAARDTLQHHNPFPAVASGMSVQTHHIHPGAREQQLRGQYGGLADLFRPHT